MRDASARSTLSALALAVLAALASARAFAVEITVSGLFHDKAVVQVDGGGLQTLAVGSKSREGVLLVSVDHDSATFEYEGQRQTLGLGRARLASPSAPEAVILTADTKGHFGVDGEVNGRSVRFLVDTGATLVALPGPEARRLGVDYRRGESILVDTANGAVTAWRVRLDTVRVGNFTQYSVDAVVVENGLPAALLGMSYLNRVNMRREGSIMTLTKRY